MDSDSSYYETTYSQDLKIEDCLRKKRNKETEEVYQLELERATKYAKYYEKSKTKEPTLFNLKGIDFIKFTSKRIKFTFQPCRVAQVSRRAIFYISLRYRKGSWLLKRDSVPVNYKPRIYELFYTNGSFRFHDDNITVAIQEIWQILVKWAKREARFRAEKFARYRNGDEDVYIDEDDEDLFLSDDEIEELHRKRDEIWERMLPPPEPTKRVRRLRKRAVKLPLSTGTSSSS